ncbi:MAG: family efflux transporter [Solirubrobacterales bacterium]|nr:family efflux transporter [Solirubrobacterales bacterium]
MRLRAHDREIFRLALPALGALAAEPSYILVDTAIVGHLGTRELAALALAATVLTAVVALCNFLAYGTTAQVARLHGAGQEARAGQIAAQALWLALAVGVGLAALVAALAHPLMLVIGGTGEAAQLAARYLRLSAAGLPFALIALAGQGYLRGVDRLRAPLVILVAANLVNVVLELVLVYGLDLGLDGSALGTVVAQAGMGAAFVVLLLRAGGPGVARRPRWADQRSLLRLGGDLLVRTGSLLAAFTLAGAVLARTSTTALAAHQVAFQLFVFLTLVLDSIAIAGQIIVGRALGAGDADGAWEAARRMIMWSVLVGCGFAAGLLAGATVLPRAFTSDAAVLAQARDLWPLFALLQPAGAIVFALDGILIGAGDTRYIAKAMAFSSLACFTPVVLASLLWDWGIVGVWAALNVLMLARLVTMAVRFRGRRWAVVGAVA